jgi:hypothetical protein
MVPHSMTGSVFALFARVCTAKETYLSASYWQEVATTLVTLTAPYAASGAAGRVLAPL